MWLPVIWLYSDSLCNLGRSCHMPKAHAAPAYSGKLQIPDYSDNDLRYQELKVSNPQGRAVLSPTPPRPDEDLTFVTLYESDEDLICAFGHHHKRGFLLVGEDGLGHLVGCDCARTRYGVEWDGFERRVDAQLTRQASLAWLHHVSAQILDARPVIDAILSDPAVAAFDQLRRDVRRLPQAVLDRCQEAAGSLETWLWGTFHRRDLTRERKNVERARAEYKAALAEGGQRLRWATADLKRSSEPVYEEFQVDVLRVPAKTIWLAKHRMRPRLEQLGRDLIGRADTLTGPQQFAHPDLVAKSLTQAAADFDAILDEINEAVAFFHGETLDRFCHWISANEFAFQGITARRLPMGIEFRGPDGIVSLERPLELRPVGGRLAGRFHLDRRRKT